METRFLESDRFENLVVESTTSDKSDCIEFVIRGELDLVFSWPLTLSN